MKKKISDLKPEEKGRIVKIKPAIKGKVAGMGMREGKTVKLNSEQPGGGPMVIEIEGRKSSIGKKMAESITVEVKE